jgi:hypothetical protein
MIKRHTTFYVNELKPIDFCGKTVMWQMDLNGAYETPFKTQPTKGEHDFNTCEGCQSTRKELIQRLTEKFNGTEQKQGFPFCCSHHSNLTKVKEFNRASFVSVPEMVADKIIYTNQHIINNHENENYYKDITDYIDYTVESFGQMPNSCGEPLYLGDYFFYVTDLLTQNTEISKERKNRLLEFLEAHQTPPTKNKNTDLNILLGTYQKWLKTFPFDISFFAELKPHFEKQLPILNGKPETNKYTGIAKAKMHTKSSLIDVLLNLTNNLLTQINTTTLYEKGLLTEPKKIKLELVLNERKTKLKQGYVNSSKDEEQRYRKILKEWFADEKRFIDEVTPIVKALPPQPIKTKQPTEEKTLSDLITHQKSVEIVEGIKIQYKNIKGKRLKLLLLALQELNLLPNERIAKKFYDCCKAEFGWDVATYPAMNDYQFNEYTDNIELDNMKNFLKEIIQSK